MNQRKLGAILSYTAQFIQILSGLVYTPIMLRLLGKSEYGLYQLVYSVISYLSLLSLGFSASYVRFYSRYKVKNDQDGIAKLNGMFLVIFSIITLVCIICGTIMTINTENIFGQGLTATELKTAKILMAIMTFNLALTFPSSVFDCIITAHEKFVIQKLLIVIQYICNPFFTLPLLMMGYGSVAMVVVTTILSILKLMVSTYFCLNKLNVQFSFNNLEFSLLKEVGLFTFFIFINQIIDQINWSVDKFLIGRMLGTATVAIYGLASTINTMYLGFSTSLSNIFIPKVNKIVAENKSDSVITNLFTQVGRIQFIILMLVVTGFVLFGKIFVTFWAGQGYEEAYEIALFLIIPVTIPLIQNLGLEIQRAKNKHRARSVVYLFISIGNIIISIPLIKLYGGTGAAIGTALSLFLGNVLFMNWYYHNKIGIDIKYFWKEIFLFTPSMMVSVVLGFALTKLFPVDSFVGMVLEIIIYSIIYCASMWFWGMNNYEKELVKPFINKICALSMFKNKYNYKNLNTK